MIKNMFRFLISFAIISLLFSGCATVLSGYEDKVDLVNAPEDIKVYSDEGIEIPTSSRTVRQFSEETKKYENIEIKTINLRKNKDHILILKSNNNEKKVEIYPKIVGTWLILDFITGIFPVFLDAYTGSWNSFQPINAGF
ncbi:MAG: hypothetical protein IPM56_17810 [Ignavibacteriales bacterium]|nr:MAG: hypothetical protein IPM56_17810 [Ignavibacteriales bacterium]